VARTFSPEFTHHRARVASLSRDRKPDDPELVSARQSHKAAALTDRIREVVASWPPLTDDQKRRLAALFAPIGGDVGDVDDAA